MLCACLPVQDIRTSIESLASFADALCIMPISFSTNSSQGEVHWQAQMAHSEALHAGSAGSPQAQEPEQAAEPAGGAHEGPPQLLTHISCSPHRLLTGQGPALDR